MPFLFVLVPFDIAKLICHITYRILIIIRAHGLIKKVFWILPSKLAKTIILMAHKSIKVIARYEIKLTAATALLRTFIIIGL
jgi:hypothetical protein